MLRPATTTLALPAAASAPQRQPSLPPSLQGARTSQAGPRGRGYGPPVPRHEGTRNLSHVGERRHSRRPVLHRYQSGFGRRLCDGVTRLAMLRHMFEHHIDTYDFFMRADDDVYVKSDGLRDLLQSVNPAQDIYMGSPGFGRERDQDRIRLGRAGVDRYCMGGPRVIFSRSALRRLGPHLNECLSNVVVSYNEDVEVGRCVHRVLNVQCTWAWEVSQLVPSPFFRGISKFGCCSFC